MKVKIGKFLNYWGPHQIADLLRHVGASKDKCFSIGEKLADTPIGNICEWIHKKRNRTESIHIDKWDTWAMDSTLALIILPMLIQLCNTKHGSPLIKDEDVPVHLRATNSEISEDGFSDSNLHKRWNWVLNEEIWAFTQLSDSDSESKFFIKKEQSVPGISPKFVIDQAGLVEHNARIDNGLRLFGTYFRNHWD